MIILGSSGSNHEWIKWGDVQNAVMGGQRNQSRFQLVKEIVQKTAEHEPMDG